MDKKKPKNFSLGRTSRASFLNSQDVSSSDLLKRKTRGMDLRQHKSSGDGKTGSMGTFTTMSLDSKESSVDPANKIVYKPKKKYERPSNMIPFHIPHKKLLEKIEYKKELPEPLSGYGQFQEKMRARKLPSIDKSIFSQADALSGQSEPPQKIVKVPESGSDRSSKITKPLLDHIPRRKKPNRIVDQEVLIEKVKTDPVYSFFYMSYAVEKSSEFFTPYALKIVPYEEIDKHNFLTMSTKGVTQYYDTEMYYTPIDVWEHEYELYCKVHAIKLFRLFREWKAFFLWRKSILFRKFHAAAKFLESNLYILIPTLRDALLAVQAMCVKLESANFMNTKVFENYLLYYFVDTQNAQIFDIKNKLLEYQNVTTEIVNTALYDELLVQGFTIDDRNLKLSQTMATSSYRKVKDGHLKMSYIEQARKKRVCGRLSCFIELIDFLTINMIHWLVRNSFTSFERIFRIHMDHLPTEAQLSGTDINADYNTGNKYSPLLIYETLMDLNTLFFDPTKQLTSEAFVNIINYWKEVISFIRPLLTNSIFDPFVSPIINNKREDRLIGYGPSLQMVLDDDKEISRLHEKIFEYFEICWNAIEMYVQRFEPVRQFYVEDVTVDRAELKKERNLVTFKNMLQRYNQEMQVIGNILSQQDIGIFRLKLNLIREIAYPEPVNLISVINTILPVIGHDQIQKIMNDVADANTYLEKEPKNTQEYVALLDYIDKLTMKIDFLESDLDYAKDLYDITDEYQIAIDNEDVEAYLNCGQFINGLRTNCDQIIENKEKIIDKLGGCITLDFDDLMSEISKYRNEIAQPWLIDSKSDPKKVQETLTRLKAALEECQTKVQAYKTIQKTYRLEVTRFDILDQAISDVKLRILLWDTLQTWNEYNEDWYSCIFSKLNLEEINDITLKNIKNVNALERGLPLNDIVPNLKTSVELMKDKLPVIQYLRNPSLRPRHWMLIENILKHKFKPDEVITLELLESLQCFNYPEQLMEIAGQASSEFSLESMLKKVEDNWKAIEFNVLPFKESKDVFILGSTEEVQVLLDESMITVNTVAASRNVGPIKPRVDEWLQKLELFSKTLDEWLSVQQQWMYLEVIFSAPDIQRQLPNESKMFQTVDKSWKEIMRRTFKIPLALQAAIAPGVLETFQKSNNLLDQIMKCLEAYLEVKRVSFPRFYFLSNDELLEILAQTRNPHAVQPHLRKCFDAIAKLQFGSKIIEVEEVEGQDESDVKPISETKTILTNDIVAMISPEGEVVDLVKGLKARGNVEDWLGRVEDAMFVILRRKMKAAIQDYKDQPIEEWLNTHPNQIVLTVSQIMWASEVHAIFESDGNKDDLMVNFLEQNVLGLNLLAELVRGDLNPIVRKIIIALITISVHARDTISLLVNNHVQSSEDFEWLKMLRYYWDKEIDNCLARMSSASYIYGYEYLGVGGVLVITPLTDRCYLCLMGALQLDLGGAPAGPAGTGKTETTKDLAKSLAIQCVVFNCSEGLDYRMMGRFFSGLAQSGAWCCFDEFNRIDIEVLSVIAQQLITIKNAKTAGLKRFMFEGREIKLVRSCAAFITMNPGYAGRTELPDNLKALFRPISMMVPDYALIAEVTLYSEGFVSSKNLAKKMTQMYKLCSEQLSQQDHYDFGMRAVKSVLVMAGSLKRASPDKNEDVVLIRALKDSNLPKFLADDALLFKGILGDLFPGVILPVPDYGLFQEAIVAIQIKMHLQPEECQINKVIQLHETMIVRWGVMLVGPTGGGKTSVLNILAGSLSKMYDDGIPSPYFQPVHCFIINPKAVAIGELYGEVNILTLEWRDGLLGIGVRKAVNAGTADHQWIVCDGPVDAVWIENLNTVLDDNKMLCLANSERIKLTPYVHMVFEVQDLSQASPATVSRCGMVYIDPGELKWMPYVKSWISKINETVLSDELKIFVLNIFERYVDVSFEFIKRNCEQTINQVDISKVTMLCKLIESILSIPGSIDKSMDKGTVLAYVAQAFVFSLLWSLGGNLTANTRDKFEVQLREKLFLEFEDADLPVVGSLWQVFLNNSSKRLDMWAMLTPEFHYDSTIPFFDMLVPTIDTVRFGYIMERMLAVNSSVMFTGDTGVGKSVIAKSVLNKIQADGYWVPVVFNFSAQTSSLRTQEMFEVKLEKKRKTVLGAPIGKKIVVFVDDVNMPKLETYGAQPPIELLRQYLDFGGLYDRKKLYWKTIVDVIITCACAPPGGGRNPLTPRFVRHFGMLSIPAPSESSMKVIFSAIIRGFFYDFSKEIQEISDPIVNSAVEVYLRIETDLLPTPDKSHYVFNLRDLSKCIQGILQADSGTMREQVLIKRLFYHECLRVFGDRLINMDDKSYFYHLLEEICKKYLEGPVLVLPDKKILDETPMLLFGDFLNTTVAKEERLYEEIVSMEKLQNCLMEYLEDYNLSASKPMYLNFFRDALEHTTIIARILRAERGNALLVGVGGMGKQSLTKLASHVNVCKVIQIELSRNYDHSSFFEDLRGMYFVAGVKNLNTTFIFTDTQILQEEFLEDVNNILNSGDVPNLFTGDDYERVMTGILEPAKKLGLTSSRDAMYDFFISRVRSNLHLSLCMSPVGDAFRRRCRMFPSLVNCCTIDWFTKWPTAALLSVATNNLQGITEDGDVLLKLANICVTIHESVEEMTQRFYLEMRRYFYTTPSSYLELLKLYKKMIAEKHEEIVQSRERIANGLKKLYETNSVVDSMKADLIAMEPSLKAKNKAVVELVDYVTEQQKEADKVRAVVLRDETAAKIKAAACQEMADEAQRDLDKAMPAMISAEKALKGLNKADITELRAFTKPPPLVKRVLEPICILLKAKTDWDSAKRVMGDNFLNALEKYPKNSIDDATLKKLQPYLKDKDLDPENVATVSKACKSMIIWVFAIDGYAKVYKEVGPKIAKQKEAENELNEVMALLKAKQKMLAEVEAKIADLQEQYRKTLNELKELQDIMNITAGRLNRAGRLTSALGNEQERWENAVENYGKQLVNLIGDILIAAASVAYLGAFTLDYRLELVSTWLKLLKKLEIPSSDTFNLITVLADPYEIRIWNTCTLPSDSVSVENAVFVTRTARWPLMIDPQEQANRWIRSLEMANGLKITKLTDPNFMRILESSIRIGVPVLLEEVGETLDPTLAPVLAKQITLTGGRLMIRLGDTDIEYDKNFKFYITTKLPNPHYMPEVCIQVTLVNFTVTPSGLEEQLLGDVVRLERPDLEKLRTECIVRINDDKNQLTNIEDKILKLLFASKGNILDDEELINTLNESKETSAVIASRLIEAETTEVNISIAREKYRTVATRGSILFFVVSQLAEIDPMYQYSLKYFNNLFTNTIEISKKDPDLPTRLEILYREITLAVYTNISRGLFERHKLVFSFLLCVHILINAGEISESKWSYLTQGPIGAQTTKLKPDVSTLSERTWVSIIFLQESFATDFHDLENDCLSNITLHIGDYTQEVSVIYNNDRLPDRDWDTELGDFEKLMLVKCLKEEKLVFCITSFVKLKLGQSFVESPQITLNLLYQDISNTTPLIFVLSTGSDPFAAFQRFAAEMECLDKIQSISLGQGQGPVAERLLEKGRLKGDWIFLQNCHLATSWMLNMERLILKLSERGTKVHPDFRLYLSSMPLKSFPVSVLQNSVKVTNEPPKGLRSNIKRAFSELTEDDFEKHPLGADWRKIIFGIIVFQAIIQERKKFGPLGWNIVYEFTDSDRECALLNFKMFCAVGYIPWDALEYITGEITYGGRVTDGWDQRCIKTILKIFFSKPTLEPGYKYSPSGIYYCPEESTLEAFKEYIDNLPLIEQPEIFGMHENANVAYQTKETGAIVDTILQSQPRTSVTTEGKSANEIVADLAALIEKSIMSQISFDEFHPPMFERDEEGRLPSLTTVLTQEIDRFNKLLKYIHSSLAMLKKAIKGFVVMSEELESMYFAFLHNQVPALWAKKAYPSLKTLGSWIVDLQLRLDFVYRWLLVGMPPSIWISGFFFPQGFITGCLQTHARKYNLPIDTLIFDFTVTNIYIDQEAVKKFNDQEGRDAVSEEFNNLPEIVDGAIVHGIFMDAARFDTTQMVLTDPYPGEMNPSLPAMILTPCVKLPEDDPRYNSPLYKTSVRAGTLSTTGHSTNFVISVLLPADQPQSYWIIRGTALLTQLTN